MPDEDFHRFWVRIEIRSQHRRLAEKTLLRGLNYLVARGMIASYTYPVRPFPVDDDDDDDQIGIVETKSFVVKEEAQ